MISTLTHIMNLDGSLSYKPVKVGKRKKGKKIVKAKVQERKAGDVRSECYKRSLGVCELKLSIHCWRLAEWKYGHMHHIKHRSLGGKNELDNVLWSCPPCHRAHHVPEKVVPAKGRL